MKKIVLLVLCFVISFSINAGNIVDLYGENQDKSKTIIKEYAQQIGEVESSLQKEASKIKDGEEVSALLMSLVTTRQQLLEKIKEEFGFYFVDFQTVFYPGNKNVYTTIEVINKSQPERLRFVNNRTVKKIENKKDDLINKMLQFEIIEARLLMENKIDLKKNSCPVFHCVTGFNHPQLKPYLKIFNTGVIKEKKLIIDTLNKDADPERRAAAAFLIGHFSDPKEIISLLSTHVGDSSEAVRNSVMRVIGFTMEKAKIKQIDANPFLRLLDSPYTTDRNKALLVLSIIADSKSSKNLILQKGKNQLLALLELKQPNNHDLAYVILKKISGKDFGENNISAWEKWFSSAQTKQNSH